MQKIKKKTADGTQVQQKQQVVKEKFIYVIPTLYSFLLKYKELQNNYKKEFGKNYKYYILEEFKNKYGKLVEYKIIKSNSKCNRVEMVFTRKDGTYSGVEYYSKTKQ